MRKSLEIAVVAIALLFAATWVAAQESVWSATMTAEEREVDGVAVTGYSRDDDYGLPADLGELSDTDFEFGGTTFTVLGIANVADPSGTVFAITIRGPRLDAQNLTFTVAGQPLDGRDSIDAFFDTDEPDATKTGVIWADPGFEWQDGQRIAVDLSLAQQPVPALPLPAIALLTALLALLGGVNARRRATSRI